MKKIFYLVVLLFFSSFSAIGQGMSVEEARKVYAESMGNKATCETAYEKISQVSNSDNHLLMGYKGAISIAMAKHLKTPKEKLSHFNKGKSLLENSISKDERNVELRFLRLTIQSNCPSALKYNKSISNDKKFIIENLASVQNSYIRSRIKEYMLQMKDISSEEKQKLNAL
jgi:hypothetical protein